MDNPAPDILKLLFGILSIIPAIVTYVVYFRNLMADKVKPHVFSWLIWGILAANGFDRTDEHGLPSHLRHRHFQS